MSTLHTGGRIVRRFAITTIALAGLAAAAAAEPPPPRPSAQGEPPLRGPAVRERDVPGVPGVFVDGDGAMRLRERIPPPVFREALMSLNADDAADELRLTEAQVSAIRALEQEFAEARREFASEHRAEFQQLRRQAAAGGGGGDGPRRPANRPRPAGDRPGDGGMEDAGEMPPRPAPPRAEPDGEMTPQRAAARERLRELERQAPQPEDFYTKVWEELTDPQRTAVDAKLDAFRAERAKEREESMVRRRVRERRPDMPPAEMAPGRDMMQRGPAADEDAPDARDRRQRMERLMRVFSRLPAEEQERILSRLEERAKQLETERPAASRPEPQRRRPGRRPPPSMDEVDIPAPE